ncbi:MAG: hypothetical protein PVJ76_04380 [Gemmatimonadota bacterium]|jgi:hypothetical protein
MLGSSVMGRDLGWHATGDTPVSWAYFLGGDMLAEFSWSPEDREVRAEVGTGVWSLPFRGLFLLQAGVYEASSEQPHLLFAGSLRRGLARHRKGLGFTLYTGLESGIGPWVGIDDEQGNGVLRARGRVGGGKIGLSVTVTPDSRYTAAVGPLLLLLGGLQVLRHKNRWLTLTTLLASEAAVQREIDHLWESSD